MAPRPNTAETVQIGVEATAGTAVAAGVRLGSLSLDLDYDIAGGTMAPTGYKYDTLSYVDDDKSKFGISGRPTYQEIVYPLSCVVGTAAVTTPTNGVKTRLWTFASSTNNADTWKTLSMERGNNARRATSAANGNIAALDFNFSKKGGCSWGGSGFAAKMHDDKVRYVSVVGSSGNWTMTVDGQTTGALAYNITSSALQTALEALSTVGTGNVAVSGGPGGSAATPLRVFFQGDLKHADTLTVSGTDSTLAGTGHGVTVGRMSPSPVEYTLEPIQGNHLDLYVADTYAGLSGASRFTVGFSGAIKWANRFAPVHYINSTQPSFADVVEDQPKNTIELLVSAVDDGADLANYIRKNQRLFLSLVATGSQIEAVTPTYYQKATFNICTLLTGSPVRTAEGAVVGYKYTGAFAHDATWGQSYEALVYTNLSALGSASL